MADEQRRFKKVILTASMEKAKPGCDDGCCGDAPVKETASQTSCCSQAEPAMTADIKANDLIESKGSTRVYHVEGMDCGSCAATIENHLRQNPKVRSVSVNFPAARMHIEHDNSIEDIVREVAKAGYKAKPMSTRRSGEEPTKTSQTAMIASGVFLVLGLIGTLAKLDAYLITALYAASIVAGGLKPARSAYYAVRSRSLDMNVLMTAAAAGAAFIGEWLEGATVVWLFALGNALQTRSIERTRNSIRSLIDLAPPAAWVKRDGELVHIPVEDIGVGTVITVKPGEKVPLDGVIVQGASTINQAPITGESIPVDKEIGDTVYAGTINEHGSLDIEVTKLTQDTTLSRIIHLVEEAQAQKAPAQAFVDRFAGIYTPIVFALALLVIVFPPLLDMGTWEEWFYRGLELLVVACPCALVISTPVAIVSAIGHAAKRGVLIKGGAFLEAAGHLTAIAFDKTGTLTEGKPQVVSNVPIGMDGRELLSIARTLESHSNHPIAKTVVAYASERGIAARSGDSFHHIVGKGVGANIDGAAYYAGNLKLFQELKTPLRELEGRIEGLQHSGHTLVIVGTKDVIIGLIALADTIRGTTESALQGLRQAGIVEVVMLTGDHEGTAASVAAGTSITRYHANLLPEDKVAAIKKLQAEGHKVAMVGDGINDAPALAVADLGIAMGGVGTDTAMETAQIVLMADNLEKLPHTIKLSRKALGIIKQNIWFSITVKLAALALIFPGWLTLWLAVLSDTGAALLVILNSMRLLRFKG
ncbi:cation-translocating P-type ATPase [Paenibacillus sp. PL2-23]|uniref:heavy metal translocating P-type ATPase n=1 Tax=Paenibacillus sp. PL2-23 TaxID=2100729 RepID=UPI0030FC749F